MTRIHREPAPCNPGHVARSEQWLRTFARPIPTPSVRARVEQIAALIALRTGGHVDELAVVLAARRLGTAMRTCPRDGVPAGDVELGIMLGVPMPDGSLLFGRSIDPRRARTAFASALAGCGHPFGRYRYSRSLLEAAGHFIQTTGRWVLVGDRLVHAARTDSAGRLPLFVVVGHELAMLERTQRRSA